jgi:5-methylcytosine-specific restriction endonuclease McrA
MAGRERSQGWMFFAKPLLHLEDEIHELEKNPKLGLKKDNLHKYCLYTLSSKHLCYVAHSSQEVIMQALTREQNEIHQYAIRLAKGRKDIDIKLIEVLQRVEAQNIHKKLEKRSLFVYATECLGLDKDVVYPLTTLARKSIEVPELKAAIKDNRVTVSKASRIVSGLNRDNAKELIEFASSHTRDEIDYEMACRNPRAKCRDRSKMIAEDVIEVKFTMSRATFEKLKRAESLQAQKNQSAQWGELIDATLESYLDKHDPVRKAERAEERILKKEAVCSTEAATLDARSEKTDQRTLTARVKNEPVTLDARVKKHTVSKTGSQRTPLTAAQRHAVFRRDGGKCTHVGLDGNRCNDDKWIDVHHIQLVSQGGSNEPENLTTLCSFHHDLAHQLTLPIEGQVTWLRSPRVAYG